MKNCGKLRRSILKRPVSFYRGGDISTSPAGEKMGSAQFTSARRIEHARAESLLLDQPDDIFGVPLVAGFEHDLELSTFGRNVEEHPTMGDLENIGAMLAEEAGDSAKHSGPVVDSDPKIDNAHFALQLAGDDRGQDAGVDIAAAQHEADFSSAEVRGVSHHCGKACGARTFGKRFDVSQIGHYGAFDVGLADEADIVHELAANRYRALGDVLHRNALGQGRAAAFRRLAAQGSVHRGIKLDLDSDHLDLRLEVLGGKRRAGYDTASADRNDDRIERRLVLDHLDPDRSLSGDDHVVIV